MTRLKKPKITLKIRSVEVDDFNKNFSLLHTKALIVDHSKAILMGSPIKQGYFNDKEHLIFDARNKGRLLHDVSIQVEGPAVAPIERTFATIWNTTSELTSRASSSRSALQKLMMRRNAERSSCCSGAAYAARANV